MCVGERVCRCVMWSHHPDVLKSINATQQSTQRAKLTYLLC